MIDVVLNKMVVIIYIVIFLSSISVFYTMFSDFKAEDVLAKTAENIVKIGENLKDGGSFLYDTEITGNLIVTNYTLAVEKDGKNMLRTSFSKMNEKTIAFSGTVNISKSDNVVDIND